MYDIIIIGGGVVGCSLLYCLSKYDLSLLLLEKECDVSCGCSKANSGIVHAGYDTEIGTLKARFNLAGSKMYPGICSELFVPYRKTGSLVLAGRGGRGELERLLARGLINGVKGLEIIGRERILEFQPNVADGIESALYAPSAAIVSPYEYTVALAEYGVLNGAKVELNSAVVSIESRNDGFSVGTETAIYDGKVVINCSGYGADVINRLAGEDELKLTFKKGEYFILDSVECEKYNVVCFPLPDERGKGVLVAPTACGNVIIGPTSVETADGTDTAVTNDGLNYIRERADSMVKGINYKNAIRVFAGVRVSVGDDFIIKNGNNPNFITVAGICSPGLTAAPAIAAYVAEEILKNTRCGTPVRKCEGGLISLPKPTRARELNDAEWADLINKDARYGNIVCRCERITEGEIAEALNGVIPPVTLDGLKRRVRSGMGRCQGGFCSAKLMEMISERFGIPLEEVTKDGRGSEIAPYWVIAD